jgi:hypothetical protein
MLKVSRRLASTVWDLDERPRDSAMVYLFVASSKVESGSQCGQDGDRDCGQRRQ